MATMFGRAARVLACDHCGAPLEVGIQAGAVRCPYCQTTNQIGARVDPDAASTAAPPITEAERIQRLREQDAKAWLMPPGLAEYALGEDLPPEKLAAAKQQWLGFRRAVQTGASFAEAEKLFHLTLILAPSVSERECRAMLESAVELLPDEGFRQVLRCRLAQAAVLAGDLAGAEEWLALVNPRPLLLLADTAYRVAASHLNRAKRQYPQVLALLGHNAGDVPLLDAWEFDCVLLRCDALENTGQLQVATAALRDHLLRDARAVWRTQATMRTAARQPLCPQACRAAYDQAWNEVDRKLRPTVAGPVIGSLATGGIGSALLTTTFVVLWPVFLGAERLSCAKNSNGAIAVNTGIWGVLLAIVGLVLLLHALMQRRLRNAGVRAFVRVLTASSRQVRGKNSVSTHWDLSIEVLGPNGQRAAKISVAQESPILPGHFPCLVDPINLANYAAWYG